MCRKTLLLILLTFAGSLVMNLQAQVPKIKKLQVEKKNSKLSITCMAQSDDGFLWLGTNKGVLKFDGLQYSHVHTSDSVAAISELHIHDNHLLIGFENGSLSEIDLLTMKEINAFSIGESRITDILKDEHHMIWVSTYGDGVWVLNGQNRIHVTTEIGLGDDLTYSLAHLSGTEEILVATDNGISIMVKNGENISCRNITEEQGLPDNLVTSILGVDNGNFVVGTQSGIVCNYNIQSNSFNFYKAFEGFSGSCVNDISSVGTEIWIATEADGVLNCNWPGTDDLQQYQLSAFIESLPVLDILPDQEGNILVAAGISELLLVDTRLCFIDIHDNVDFRNITAIHCNREGNIWFSNTTGLYEHSANFISRNLVKQWLSDLDQKGISIISIHEDTDGNLWFGTFDKGVGRIDNFTGELKWYREENGLVNNNVLSICGKGKEVWFATLGGVSQISDPSIPVFQNFDATSPLGSSYIFSVFCDSKERIWFGTDGKGPVFYDGNQFQFLRTQFKDVSKSIVSITEDRSGNIWFYSSDKKLSYFDGTKLVQQEITNEGNEVDIFSMQGDDLGSLVLFTSDGIAILDAISQEMTFIEKNTQYNSSYLNTISKDPQGQLWIGSEKALIRLREIVPGKINRPRTVITKVLSFLQPADTSQGLVFKANQNHITFEYCGLWLRDPDKISYQYKLEGYSLEWTSTKDNMVIFPQLPPGDYTFRVRSSVSTGFENSTEDSIRFTILKPIWKTWWFILGVAILLSALIVLIYKLRLNAFRKRESIKRELIQSQFDTLRNQVNPHFLFNSLNTLISLISTDPDVAIHYVEKLSDYFRNILQQQDKEIISLGEELQLVQNYFYLQQKRFGDNLQLEIDIPEKILHTPIPPLTLQILAENSIKHNVISKSKPLLIKITFVNSTITISNNLQEKLTKEPSTGIGLKNIMNRYAILFNKEIEVMKGEKEYIVRLPVVNVMN